MAFMNRYRTWSPPPTVRSRCKEWRSEPHRDRAADWCSRQSRSTKWPLTSEVGPSLNLQRCEKVGRYWTNNGQILTLARENEEPNDPYRHFAVGKTRDVDALTGEVEERRLRNSVMPVLALLFAAYSGEVAVNHLRYEIVEAGFVPPAEPLTRLRRVADQEVDLAGTEIARINFDQYLLRTGVNALFINS